MSRRPRAEASALMTALVPAVRHIVSDALARGAGATLPTNADYLRDHGMGAGTIQRALTLLRDIGALQVTSRGHMGRVIDEVDVGPAWQAAGLAPVRVLMPPSGTAEEDVLERLLGEELTGLGIPHAVHHRRGSAARLELVDNCEFDLTLVSAGVASRHGEAPSDLTRVLAPGTYYAPQRMVVVRRTDRLHEPIKRVATDANSFDHETLSRAELPESEGYQHVQTSFTQVPAAVLRGDVDAGLWHIRKSVVPLDLAGLSLLPLGPRGQEVCETLSPAALVACRNRPELAAVLAALSFNDLVRQQAEAIELDSDRDD